MSLTKVTMSGAINTLHAGWDKFNDLIDDLLSTDNGLGASQLGLEDSAGNVDAEDVEAAIAEIYSDTSTVRTLGEVFAENSSTTTGLTWGYKAGSVRFDNTITAVAASTVSLTNNATNYVEINSAGTVSRNTTGFTSGQIPLRTVVTSAGVQTTSTDKRCWFQSWDVPLPVAKGGTGAATLTDGGLLLGSGTGAVTALGVATNGQIPIGDGTTDPVLATITGTSNQITITNAAGSITLSIPDTAAITFSNAGLHVLDTNASHDLIITPGSNLTADRILTITTGDAARGITISATGTVMIGDGGTTKCWFYLNAAPTGWTIDNTPADALLCVKGGTAAFNAAGGTQAGTWTQPNHTHTHNHKWYKPNDADNNDQSYDTDGVLATITAGTAKSAPGPVFIEKRNGTSITPIGDEWTDNDATTGATAATWRPLAQLGIIATLNA